MNVALRSQSHGIGVQACFFLLLFFLNCPVDGADVFPSLVKALAFKKVTVIKCGIYSGISQQKYVFVLYNANIKKLSHYGTQW